jgi:hypothetical protein
MDPISSSTTGAVSAKTTNQTAGTEAAAADATTKSRDGLSASASDMHLYQGAPLAAKTADIPEPPAGPPGPGFGQEVLDRAFSEMDKLEKELKKVDPTTPEGSKRMAEITRQLNRLDELIRMVNEMRRSRHEANMAVINNIA